MTRRKESAGTHGHAARLLVSHLTVALVGLVTAGVAIGLIGPPLFADQMHRRMMGQLMHDPAARDGMHTALIDPELSDTFAVTLYGTLGLAGVAAGLTGLAASLLLTRQVAGPVRRLAAASRRLAAGHYDERVPVAGDDELAALAADFNALADALAATEQRRRALIGDVAHEMRTPLTVIQGNLEGLLDGVVEPGDDVWARLHGEADRLRHLVDDLQELSRAEAGQIRLDVQTVRPESIVAQAVERLASRFAESGLRLVAEARPDLPAVQADPERVLQVLTNVLTNALRHTGSPGSVTLEVAGRERGVAFLVRDSGVGIAAEHLPHIFERFYRVDPARSRASGGSGVGLTIARALVEAMGGTIWAESAGLGQGTTVGFTLPVAPARPAERAA